MRRPVQFMGAILSILAVRCMDVQEPVANLGQRGTELRAADRIGVSPLFDFGAMETTVFPSDFFTVLDSDQLTGQRVAMPKPDCAQMQSDCEDVALLNLLDGFNLQPRIAIPFSGDIQVQSVSSASVFLIALQDMCAGGDDQRGEHNGANENDCDDHKPVQFQKIGVNQIVWDPGGKTLYAESDELLDQHSRYALLVTDGVLDMAGRPIVASKEFRHFSGENESDDASDDSVFGPAEQRYKKALKDALSAARQLGVKTKHIAVASVFTTQTITAPMERLRDSVRALPAPEVTFELGPSSSRTAFQLSGLKSIVFKGQTQVNPPTFTLTAISLPALKFVSGAVATIAYGRMNGPVFLQDNNLFPARGTKRGVPPLIRSQELYFNVYLPSGTKPGGGWPVAVVGSGANQSKEVLTSQLAAKLAANGIATICINAAGRGLGPLSTNRITLPDNSVVEFLAGGRGGDTNGDNTIGLSEGADASGSNALAVGRDSTKQTIIDNIQLARAIEAGIDADGDGSVDLDKNRIHFIGWSFGSNYGIPLVALDPAFKATVLNEAGGPLVDNRRLGINKSTVGALLAARVPSLINLTGTNFDENLPLRNQPPLINTVPGAIAIQRYIDRNEWAQQSSDAVTYAPYLQRRPLAGNHPRPVLVQMAKGDQTVPNPAEVAVIRAGRLDGSTTYYRHDLAWADDPSIVKNPHPFMSSFILDPKTAAIGSAAQDQAATFMASQGETISRPTLKTKVGVPLFEVPIPLPLPETLGFIL